MSHYPPSKLLLNKQFCDAVIRVNNVEFHVHKIILCKCSSFFRGCSVICWREDTGIVKAKESIITSAKDRRGKFCRWANHDDREFNISIVSADMMKLIIDFAYTDSVTVTEDNVQELFVAADMLNVMGIVEACCSFMEEHIIPQNCINMWCFTTIYSFYEIHRKAFSFIMKHFEEVAATSEEFLLLSVDDLVKIIKEDQLHVKQEKTVFEAVLRWIIHAAEERIEHVHLLLSNVRLASINQEYWQDILSNSDLVGASERCQRIISVTLKTMLDQVALGLSDLDRPRLPPAILFTAGSSDNIDKPINVLQAYDVRADSWVKIIKDKSARWGFGLVFNDGSLYRVGGIDRDKEWSRSLQRLDLSTNTWHELSHMHFRRTELSVTVLDGCIYAIGGEFQERPLRNAERYDPSTNQWTIIASMNVKRSLASCTTLNGKVYICGGLNTDAELSSAECYDPATNQWTLIADMITRRQRHGVIAYAGRVFVVGGTRRRDPYGNVCLRSVKSYDPRTNTWRVEPYMTYRRCDFGIGVIDDRLFVIGGNFNNSLYKDCQCFDVNTGKWSQVCDMRISCCSISCCVAYGLPNLSKYAAPRRYRRRLRRRTVWWK